MLKAGIYLGKYRIIRLVGSGGMADVYEAEDTTLGRRVALKVLPPEFARDEERVARFQKEVRAAAQLSHPNIVVVYEVGEDKGYYFYSMQLVTGGDLKERIRQGLDPQEALNILKQIASALTDAHAHGFVHRDIKPENILFDEKGNALLTDLGIARVMSSGTRLTKTGMSIGTPHYMSPEQARGLDVDGRSDLYSLGIVFYEMLTGKVPYTAEETVAIAYKHVNDPLPELPLKLKKYQPILDNLLAKEPADRYQSADALIRDIELIQSGGSLKRPSHVFRTISEASKKGPAWAWAFGGAVLALILVGFLYGHEILNLFKSTRPVVGGGGTLVMSSSAVSSPVIAAPKQKTSPMPSPNKAILKNEPSPSVSQPVSPAPVVKKGRAIVYIESKPKGAELYLDGMLKGNTPFQADDFPSGTHEIMLKHKYYDIVKEKITLEDDVVYKKTYVLKKGQGHITVLSKPDSALVYLDSKKQKGTTPLTLSGVLAGEHEVRVHKDRYYDTEEKVEVLPNKTTKLVVTLTGGNLVLYKGKWLEPDKAEALKQKDFKDLIKKAKIEIKKQNFKRAKQYIKSARKIFSSHSDLKKVEQQLKEAKFKYLLTSARGYLHKGALQKAKKSLEQAKALFSNDPAISPLMQEWKKKKKEEEIRKLAGEFVWVSGGCYEMGCGSWTSDCDGDEYPVHTVCVNGFWMGKYEVTFAQYDRFCEETGRDKPDDEGWGRGNRPVINVSWNDAKAFAKWLSKKTGRTFRLPTEAEWEYAARSRGRKVKYGTSTGGLSHDLANYDGTGGRDRWEYTSPVGSFAPNSLGLYDMSGNVWEWCEDVYNENAYKHHSRNNPIYTGSGSSRVIRGGSWGNEPRSVRCAIRGRSGPGDRLNDVGFRLVCEKH